MKIVAILLGLLFFVAPASANLFGKPSYKKCQTYEEFVQVVETKDRGSVKLVADWRGMKAQYIYEQTSGDKTRLVSRYIIIEVTGVVSGLKAVGNMAAAFAENKCALGFVALHNHEVAKIISAMKGDKGEIH